MFGLGWVREMRTREAPGGLLRCLRTELSCKRLWSIDLVIAFGIAEAVYGRRRIQKRAGGPARLWLTW
jgi:hypothetical protein